MTARLPLLVRSVANLSGVPRPTVEVIARYIREAGILTTLKRGRGAAQMTAADAALLLLAVNTAARPSDAVETVMRYTALPAPFRASGDPLKRAQALEGLGPVVQGFYELETVQEVLVWGINMAPDERLKSFNVTFNQSWPAIQVKGGFDIGMQFEGEDQTTPLGLGARFFQRGAPEPDLDTQRLVKIGIRTFRRLAETIGVDGAERLGPSSPA